MHKMTKALLMGVVANQLMGCASLELMIADGVSYMVTGKGLPDQALSLSMGKDCAFYRLFSKEGMCQEGVDESALSEDTMLANTMEAQPRVLLEQGIEESTSHNMSQMAVSLEPEAVQQDVVETVAPTIQAPALVKGKPQESSELYAVVGSFNDLRYAFERSTLYRGYNSQVVETPEGSVTRYRVVIGPLDNRELIALIPKKPEVKNTEFWTITLCPQSLLPPPCEDGLLASR